MIKKESRLTKEEFDLVRNLALKDGLALQGIMLKVFLLGRDAGVDWMPQNIDLYFADFFDVCLWETTDYKIVAEQKQ